MTAGLIVYKMTGSGNDFVFVDGRGKPGVGWWTGDRISVLCGRRTGVGADGLVILEPGSRAGAVRYHFYNSDGSRAAMCGNGALCATRLAAFLEMAPGSGMTLETDAGPYQTRCLDGPGERAELTLGNLCAPGRTDVRLATGESEAFLMVVGVPHLVVLVDDVGKVAVPERGRALRFDTALGDGGANVNFVSRDPRDDIWVMRTYERGVEGETLACGTGAVAAAAVVAWSKGAALPLEIQTRSGRRLGVSASDAGPNGVRNARLSGEGRLVFRAVLGNLWP